MKNKIKISELRPLYVLPGIELAIHSILPVKGITINHPDFFKEDKWWKYEKYLDIHFGEGEVEGDITQKYPPVCIGCKGQCCKDIPTHNLRMYVSQEEIYRIVKEGHTDFTDEKIRIDEEKFGVLKVKDNGDCHFLTEKGCKLGNNRPLWCKLWICEKFKEVLKNEGYV